MKSKEEFHDLMRRHQHATAQQKAIEEELNSYILSMEDLLKESAEVIHEHFCDSTGCHRFCILKEVSVIKRTR